jgi:hypothetical protein
VDQGQRQGRKSQKQSGTFHRKTFESSSSQKRHYKMQETKGIEVRFISFIFYIYWVFIAQLTVLMFTLRPFVRCA